MQLPGLFHHLYADADSNILAKEAEAHAQLS